LKQESFSDDNVEEDSAGEDLWEEKIDMVKSELIQRSPLRIFEKSIHGGLGKGHIGVIASKKGVGKTACLTHMAVDKLFQDQNVIHVSYAANVDHIVSWYEDIFKEIAKKRELEHAVDVHDELVKHRVIMNFSQEGTTIDQVIKSIEAMINDGNFQANMIIFDGYKLHETSGEDFRAIKEFAERIGLEIWYSISLDESRSPVFDENDVPVILKDHTDVLDVIINLRHEGDYIHLEVAKDRETIQAKDMELKLDPKTLLIAEE
jgi:KaiC/GvpD/RAD55 family RecA-like ATPase